MSTTRIKTLLHDMERNCMNIGRLALDHSGLSQSDRFNAIFDIALEIRTDILQICDWLEADNRVEYIVQKVDAVNEARGAAIQAVGEFKRGRMTPEEIKEKADADTDDLFGSANERSGL